LNQYLFSAVLVLAFGACDGNSGGGAGDLGIRPDVDKTCGPGIYPCGPYGTKYGDRVLNMVFQGIMDPDEQCKKDSAKQHDTSQERTISFRDYHLGSSKSGCSSFNKQLLWVMVSAGWCGSCQVEVNTTSGKYSKDEWFPKTAVINVVVDNKTRNVPADLDFIKLWAKQFNATFPVVRDPTFQMGRYFNRDNMPYNLLVDLRTMTIYYQQLGGKLEDVEDRVRAFK
jgi:hypothetical protein